MNIIFALLLLLQPSPNFSGVWELNKTGSTPSPNMPERMRAKIDHQGSAFSITMRVTARGQVQQQSMKYTIGAESKNEMHGAPMTSQSSWDGDTLVIRSVAVIMSKELRLTDRFTLSADGKTLTFRERHQYGSEPEGEDVRTLDRQSAESWEPDAPPKPAEEVYKNIQIMKGLPAPRLQAVMLNLTTWLGVQCAHCHVLDANEQFQFEKGDKPAKQTARKMFLMVRKIGQDNYPNGNPVTCWTCHRGNAKPESMPPSK